MTAAELADFFKKEQNQSLSAADAAKLIVSVSANDATLDCDEFELLMIGKVAKVLFCVFSVFDFP